MAGAGGESREDLASELTRPDASAARGGDVDDAGRLGRDPVMRWIVGGHAVTEQAVSTRQMRRFETEVLATVANFEALADISDNGSTRFMTGFPVSKSARSRADHSLS